MYKYEPRSKKTREKTILFLFLLLAVIAFGSSKIPGILYPSLLQLFAVFMLIGVVMIVSRCLMRRFIYSVEPREGAGEEVPMDLVITEVYGNRMSVVCRISVTDVEEAIQITPQNKKEISATTKGKLVYRYTEEIFPEDYRMLVARIDEELVYIKISANQDLIEAIFSN